MRTVRYLRPEQVSSGLKTSTSPLLAASFPRYVSPRGLLQKRITVHRLNPPQGCDPQFGSRSCPIYTLGCVRRRSSVNPPPASTNEVTGGTVERRHYSGTG